MYFSTKHYDVGVWGVVVGYSTELKAVFILYGQSRVDVSGGQFHSDWVFSEKCATLLRSVFSTSQPNPHNIVIGELTF